MSSPFRLPSHTKPGGQPHCCLWPVDVFRGAKRFRASTLAADFLEALRVFECSLSHKLANMLSLLVIGIRLEQEFGFDILALCTGMRPVIMVDYGGVMPELGQRLCAFLKICHKDEASYNGCTRASPTAKQLIVENELPQKLQNLIEERRDWQSFGGQVLVKQMATSLLKALHINTVVLQHDFDQVRLAQEYMEHLEDLFGLGVMTLNATESFVSLPRECSNTHVLFSFYVSSV